MKLIAPVKLLTIPESQTALLQTLEAANAAWNAVSASAWQQHTFGKYAIQKDRYYRLKAQFGLTAQLVIRVIANGGDAYKRDKRTKRTFKPHGSSADDARIVRWNLRGSTVSIWTLDGRVTIPVATGARQRELLQSHHGESDLVYHNGSFYLLATCAIPEPEPVVVEGILGVDRGLATIATDSDGTRSSGTQLKRVRHRHTRLRRKLQKKGTRAAKRRRKKLSGQEKRFAQNTQHMISKQIVEKAHGTQRAIAIEHLGGIRSRTTVRKSQRVYLQSWSLYQLRTFLE